MKSALKWTLIHLIVTFSLMITLFSFSMSYGFDGETSETVNTLVKVWSKVVGALMFPLIDLWVELPKHGFWSSSIFEWFWLLLNSSIWGVTISLIKNLFSAVENLTSQCRNGIVNSLLGSASLHYTILASYYQPLIGALDLNHTSEFFCNYGSNKSR